MVIAINMLAWHAILRNIALLFEQVLLQWNTNFPRGNKVRLNILLWLKKTVQILQISNFGTLMLQNLWSIPLHTVQSSFPSVPDRMHEIMRKLIYMNSTQHNSCQWTNEWGIITRQWCCIGIRWTTCNIHNIDMWKQEGQKQHFGWNWIVYRYWKIVNWHILSHSAGLKFKYLHFYGRNKMSKNSEIQSKSEHKIAFSAKWRKGTYDLRAFNCRYRINW